MPLSHAVHRRSGTVIDAVDDDKELTFALIQDHCARECRRTTCEPDRHGPARGDDRRFVRPQPGTRVARPLGICNYGGLIDTLFTDVEGVA